MKKTITTLLRPFWENKALWSIVLLGLLWACSSSPDYESPDIEGNFVVINIDELLQNTPKFYTYRAGRKKVNFFVVRTADSAEAYLDACMKCYPHKKGYRVEGFFVVCRYCGNRYPIDNLKTGIGTCYPIPLKSEIKNRFLLISTKSLKEAERYF